jgi:hypothetical protein
MNSSCQLCRADPGSTEYRLSGRWRSSAWWRNAVRPLEVSCGRYGGGTPLLYSADRLPLADPPITSSQQPPGRYSPGPRRPAGEVRRCPSPPAGLPARLGCARFAAWRAGPLIPVPRCWRTVTTHVDPWAWGWSAISALAATAAVITALTVATIQMRDLLRLRRRENLDRRREQALLVSAWATSETDLPNTPQANITGNPWYAAVHVLNGSGASISDVRVQIGHRSINGQWDSLGEIHEWVIVPPRGTRPS